MDKKVAPRGIPCILANDKCPTFTACRKKCVKKTEIFVVEGEENVVSLRINPSLKRKHRPPAIPICHANEKRSTLPHHFGFFYL